MANNTIVISRIQNRRGRRENLPQPLLPGEVALTADTDQVWIGGDPTLNVPSTRVYKDQLQGTAQEIINNNLVEAVFTEEFTQSDFNQLVLQLEADVTVTLSSQDILFDDTYRGSIIRITVDDPGTGYTTGDLVTAVSATGYGFQGTVVDDGSGGIDSITIVDAGRNYLTATTTFTIAGGSDGELSIDLQDVHGYSVFIAADDSVDPNNTVNNVVAAVEATGVGVLTAITGVSGALGGSFRFPGLGGSVFTSDVLFLDTQDEATHVTTLINRINASTPGQITGLVHTTLNIEVTGSSDNNGLAEVLNVFSTTVQTTNATQVTLQSLTIEDGFQNLIVARVKGYEPATGDAVWKYIRAAVKNIAGTVTFIGSLSADYGYDPGASAWDITMSASGDQVLIEVTGETAHIINWETVTEVSYAIDETVLVPILPSHTHQLSDLTDVGATTPTSGNLLVADGDSWESMTRATADVGYLYVPQNIQNGDYELELTDAGGHIYKNAGGPGETITIPANIDVPFPIGSAITIVNRGGDTLTVAIDTDTLQLAGGTSTGSRVLADGAVVTVLKVDTTVWMIAGSGVT